jgi:flagellar motor protein MotB
MQVVGYGEFRPRFRNDTQEKRALNRRIDVIIKPQ